MNQVIIGSDNGLSTIRRHVIIWTGAVLLSIGPLGTNFSEILIKIQNFSFTKMHPKISPAKRRPFCPGGWVKVTADCIEYVLVRVTMPPQFYDNYMCCCPRSYYSYGPYDVYRNIHSVSQCLDKYMKIIRWEIVVIQHHWWNTAVVIYMDIGLYRCPPPSRKK